MAATRIITNAWKIRTLPDIFYEEKEPEEDSMLQELPIDRITHLLRERYEDQPEVFISREVFVSYDITNGSARVGPDLFIAFDVDVAGIRENLPNFWIWEIGKAPDFVMEVASSSTAANDLGWKRDLYQRLGVQEYWRFDPTGGRLYGQGHCRGSDWLATGMRSIRWSWARTVRRAATASCWTLCLPGMARSLTCWTRPLV